MKYIAIIDEEMLSDFRIDDPLVMVVTDKLGFTKGIQLKPLKKGHWIKHHNDNLGRCMRDLLECSVCGKMMCESPYQSFCPSCGAEMR